MSISPHHESVMLNRYLHECHNINPAHAVSSAALKTKNGDHTQAKAEQAVRTLDAEMRAMTDSRILKEAQKAQKELAVGHGRFKTT